MSKRPLSTTTDPLPLAKRAASVLGTRPAVGWQDVAHTTLMMMIVTFSTWEDAFSLSMTSQSLYRSEPFWVRFCHRRSPYQMDCMFFNVFREDRKWLMGLLLTNTLSKYVPDQPRKMQWVLEHKMGCLYPRLQRAVLALPAHMFTDKPSAMDGMLLQLDVFATAALQEELLCRPVEEFTPRRGCMMSIVLSTMMKYLRTPELQRTFMDRPASDFENKKDALGHLLGLRIGHLRTPELQQALLDRTSSEFNDKPQALYMLLQENIKMLKTPELQQALLDRPSSEFNDKPRALDHLLQFIHDLQTPELQQRLLDRPESDFRDKNRSMHGVLYNIHRLHTAQLQQGLLERLWNKFHGESVQFDQSLGDIHRLRSPELQQMVMDRPPNEFYDKKAWLQRLLETGMNDLRTPELQQRLMDRLPDDFLDKKAGLQHVLERIGYLQSARLQEGLLDRHWGEFTDKALELRKLRDSNTNKLRSSAFEKLLDLPAKDFKSAPRWLRELHTGAPHGRVDDKGKYTAWALRFQ